MIGRQFVTCKGCAGIRFWAKVWGLLGHHHIYDILSRLISILTPFIYANYVSIASVWQPNFRHLEQARSTIAAKYFKGQKILSQSTCEELPTISITKVDYCSNEN